MSGKIHYDLYDRQREKRQALDRWAHALSAIVDGRFTGAEIVPLRRVDQAAGLAGVAAAKRAPRKARS